MSEFTIADVPRAPDDAVKYLLEYIAERREYFFNGRSVRKTRWHELEEVLHVLRYALSKSAYNERLGQLARLINDAIENGFQTGHIDALPEFVDRAKRSLRLAGIEDHFKGRASITLFFQLNDTDSERAVKLVRECRSIIEKSDFFESAMRARLLARLDQIMGEIEGKTGRFDIILGGLVDFGDALGKFGDKAKPLFDRIREVRSLAQATVKQYQGLPAPDNSPGLPPPFESDKKSQVNDILIPKFNDCRSALNIKTEELIEIISAKLLDEHRLEVPAAMRKTARTFLGYIRQSLDEDAIMKIFSAVSAAHRDRQLHAKKDKGQS